MFLIVFVLELDAGMLSAVTLLFTLQLYKMWTSVLVYTPLNEADESKNWYVQALRQNLSTLSVSLSNY